MAQVNKRLEICPGVSAEAHCLFCPCTRTRTVSLVVRTFLLVGLFLILQFHNPERVLLDLIHNPDEY